MVELGPGQKPLVQIHYPHMLAEDIRVWTKFLRTDAHRFREVWYDLRVGQPVLLEPGASDMDKRIAAGLTRKRIDVVALVEGGYWVVEVKPYANMYAMGQILTYVRLFEQEYITKGEVTPVLVCDSYDLDLLEELDEFGILVLETA
ncbi:hypothetical protein ES707_22397 [subsurface metagenome]